MMASKTVCHRGTVSLNGLPQMNAFNVALLWVCLVIGHPHAIMIVTMSWSQKDTRLSHYGNQSRCSLMGGWPLWPPAVPRLADRPSQSNPQEFRRWGSSGPSSLMSRASMLARLWLLTILYNMICGLPWMIHFQRMQRFDNDSYEWLCHPRRSLVVRNKVISK